jgi:hypothetical protein
MIRRPRNLLVSALILVALILSSAPAFSAEVPVMNINELKERLDDGKTIIIDVRRDGDFEAGETKIKGALREEWEKPSKWAKRYDKGTEIVLYCA